MSIFFPNSLRVSSVNNIRRFQYWQDVICEENNPFKLAVGQEIKVVAVETVTPDLKAAGLLT